MFYSFTINGATLSQGAGRHASHSLVVCYVNGAGAELVVSGEEDGALHFRRTNDLAAPARMVQIFQAGVPIRSVALNPSGSAILAGSERGSLTILQLSEVVKTLEV